MPVVHVEGLGSAPVTQIMDEGKYSFQVVSVTPFVSGTEKHTPGWKFDLIVLQGPIQQTMMDPAGHHVFWTVWITQIGLSQIARLMKALKIPQSDDPDTDDFVGKAFIGTIKHRTAKNGGDPFEEVSNFKPLPADPYAEPAPEPQSMSSGEYIPDSQVFTGGQNGSEPLGNPQ